MSAARVLRRLLTWNSRVNAVRTGRTGAYMRRAATMKVVGKMLGGLK